jgi:V8-like Glu-specific endopeptidase
LLQDLDNDPSLKEMIGSDDRQLRTSSEYPWRAVGVALVHPDINDATPHYYGSGFMVGPRHVLTAAHVVSDDGNSLNPVRAAPAARGEGYSGNRWPWNRRIVQGYYWPNGWNGGNLSTDARYDYAVLILLDSTSSPGWIGFAYNTVSWTDFWNYHTAGYPGRYNESGGFNYCTASPLADGRCGGYMYYEYAQVRSVFPGHFYHRHDIQPGQSGSPIYRISQNGNRFAYGIVSRGGAGFNIAHRIRSGSFDSICNWIAANPSTHFTNVSC